MGKRYNRSTGISWIKGHINLRRVIRVISRMPCHRQMTPLLKHQNFAPVCSVAIMHCLVNCTADLRLDGDCQRRFAGGR